MKVAAFYLSWVRPFKSDLSSFGDEYHTFRAPDGTELFVRMAVIDSTKTDLGDTLSEAFELTEPGEVLMNTHPLVSGADDDFVDLEGDVHETPLS